MCTEHTQEIERLKRRIKILEKKLKRCKIKEEELVKEIEELDQYSTRYEIQDKGCPLCGNDVTENNLGFGILYVCSNSTCEYRKVEKGENNN